jgi:choline dehydrogenase
VPGEALDCDFLVIGAGSAGCVLANRLSENPAHRVILVEAGGRGRDPLLDVPGAVSRTLATKSVNWGYVSEPEPGLDGRRVPLFRGKVLGGTSVLNGMIYIRGHPRDYDYWRQDGCVGWSYEDVLPFFRKAEGSERGSDAHHGGQGPLRVTRGRPDLPICEAFLQAAAAEGYPVGVDFNGASQEGFGHYDVTIHRGRRWSAARAYLTPARARPNLVVLTDCTAETLLFEGTRAIGAELTRHGMRQRVTVARETVLAAGVFNSPKLLMLSGIGPAEHLRALGIAIRADRGGVGGNLRDHVSYRMNYACRAPVTAYAQTRGWRAAACVLRYLTRRQGILAGTSFTTGGFFRSHDGLEIPDMQVGLCIGLLPEPGRMLPGREGFTVTIRQGRPASHGDMRLRSADPGDAPLIRPRYFSDPADMPILMRGIRRFRRLFDQPALRDLIDSEIEPGPAVAADDVALAASIRALSNTTHHFVGTCRMGADDAAVVDPHLRVRGFERLRVIDASVMPTHINGNTHAPTVMIAEKGASMMLAG